MLVFINKRIPNQIQEKYYGNREYKLLLSDESYIQSNDSNKLIPFNKKYKENKENIESSNTKSSNIESSNTKSTNINNNMEYNIQIAMNINKLEQQFLKNIITNNYDQHDLNSKLNIAYDLFKIQNQQKINNFILNNIKLHYNSKKRQHNLNKKLQKRVTQLMFRLNEGKGKALYIIGIGDDGDTSGIKMEQIFDSIYYLEKMINIIKANVQFYRIYLGKNGFVLTTRITLLPFKEIEYFA
jgi:hypothetical protein